VDDFTLGQLLQKPARRVPKRRKLLLRSNGFTGSKQSIVVIFQVFNFLIHDGSGSLVTGARTKLTSWDAVSSPDTVLREENRAMTIKISFPKSYRTFQVDLGLHYII